MMKKQFVKILCLLLITYLVFDTGIALCSAKELPNKAVPPAPCKNAAIRECSNEEMPLPYQAATPKIKQNITRADLTEAKANGFDILEKVSDEATIQKMVDSGLAERDENGNLPISITTYFAPNQTAETLLDDTMLPLSTDGITVTKKRHYNGRYFDDYDRYVVDGPSKFTTTYSRTAQTNWNTSMSGEISAGGKVYGIAEVKAKVSAKVGYSFGVESTQSQTYTVNIPKGKYWEIKIWTSYLVHEYAAMVGKVTLGTGYTWKPNGLVIQKTEYKSK